MREILFRGKGAHSGKWVEGDLLSGGYDYVTAIRKFSEMRGVVTGVAPETIGQYTGLTDKNGEKIFEGDILQFDYKGKNLGVNGVAAVVFENGKFGVKWGNYKQFVCLDGFANTTLEVIGNIYDNPELIED